MQPFQFPTEPVALHCVDEALNKVRANATDTFTFASPDDASEFADEVLRRYHPDGYGTYCVIDKETGCRVQWRVWGAE